MNKKSIVFFPFLILTCFFLLSFTSFGEEDNSVQISEEIIPIRLGSSYQLTISNKETEESYNNYTWHSSDESIVTVSSDGMVSALAVGEATIYLEDESGSILSDTCLITVMDSVDKIWGQIDGERYLFTNDGFLTGWQIVDGQWYYLNAVGTMTTGWKNISEKWYFFDSDGVMTTGWQYVDGKWYYMNPSGSMLTGWIKPGDSWYYLNSSGAMVIG